MIDGDTEEEEEDGNSFVTLLVVTYCIKIDCNGMQHVLVRVWFRMFLVHHPNEILARQFI
jgi:hypothetical protein